MPNGRSSLRRTSCEYALGMAQLGVVRQSWTARQTSAPRRVVRVAARRAHVQTTAASRAGRDGEHRTATFDACDRRLRGRGRAFRGSLVFVVFATLTVSVSSAEATHPPSVVDEELFTYAGATWSAYTVSGARNDDTRYTWTTNATWSYTFTGVQAKIYGSKFYNSGIAAISVDGGTETLVDLYSLSSRHQDNYYSTPLLQSATHTIRVRNTGLKNTASAGYSVHADGVDVYTADTATTTTTTSTTITTRTTAPTPHIVYRDDSLASGWANWSWNTVVNLNLSKDNGALAPGTDIPPRAVGRSAISVRHIASNAGLNLHSNSGVSVSGYQVLTLYARTDPGNQVSLAVQLVDDAGHVNGNAVALADVPNGKAYNWHTSTFRRYDLRLVEDFAFTGAKISGIHILNLSGAATPTYYVDEIVLNPRLADANCGISAPQGGIELRPENDVANHQAGGPLPADPGDIFHDGEYVFEREYYPKIDGNCRGTTEQIIEWAARKWGFADQASVLGGPPLNRLDAVKAQVVIESDWFQNVQGDFHCGADRPNGIGASHSIVGLKNAACDNSNDNWRNSYPRSASSTALALDYAYAAMRATHDCKIHWTCNAGISALTGDARVNAALRAWVCGCGPSNVPPWAEDYLAKLLTTEISKPWLNDAAWRAMRW